MNRIISTGLISVLVTFTFSCATIARGNKQTINIWTNPDSAKITIHNMKQNNKVVYSGTTPYQVELKTGSGYFSGAKYLVKIAKEGFEPFETIIDTSLRYGWYLGGNLIFGGLIGYLVVDPLSGAMWSLDIDNVQKDLKIVSTDVQPEIQKDTMKQSDSNTLIIILRKNLPEKLAGYLRPLN